MVTIYNCAILAHYSIQHFDITVPCTLSLIMYFFTCLMKLETFFFLNEEKIGSSFFNKISYFHHYWLQSTLGSSIVLIPRLFKMFHTIIMWDQKYLKVLPSTFHVLVWIQLHVVVVNWHVSIEVTLQRWRLIISYLERLQSVMSQIVRPFVFLVNNCPNEAF